MEFELNDCKMKYEDGEFYWLKGNKWFVKKKCEPPDGTKYQRLRFSRNKKNISYSVHRVVYWLFNQDWDIHDKTMYVDHIDRNTRNNDISNLRLLNPQESKFNTNSKGYSYRERDKNWVSRLMVDGKHIYLGSFDNEDDARNAYLEAKKKYHIIKS
tara:strand:+ start:53 stop:520 length:468 start_codon:yes stop_codon:yes gene_type:complete